MAYVREIASIMVAVPLLAAAFIPVVPIMADGDSSSGKITGNPFLAPIFFTMRFFVSHRGFTHGIPGIALVGLILWFLSQFHLDPLAILFFDLISLSILWTVLKKGWIRVLLSVLLVVFSPMLLDVAYYHAFLLAMFILYVSHMPGDIITSEGLTIIEIGSFKIHIQIPIFSFDAGGWIERRVIYPILILAIAYFLIGELDFWKVKFLSEGMELIRIYKQLFF